MKVKLMWSKHCQCEYIILEVLLDIIRFYKKQNFTLKFYFFLNKKLIKYIIN